MSIFRRLKAAAGTGTGEDWNLATATFNGTPAGAYDVAAQETAPTDVFFRDNGLSMYIVGYNSGSVLEYTLSTAWDISTASFVRSFSVAAKETTLHGVFFRPTGTQMYVIGTSSDSIHEYNLGTAWNISTASFVRSFSISGQETNSRCMFFRADGLRMYITGFTGDAVYEYTLSTAWNISTATFFRSFSVAGQTAQPHALFFRADGLRMYVTGTDTDSVHEYSLSTAWAVNTASFVRTLSVVERASSPAGLFFRADGLKMYNINFGGSLALSEYDLSTAWDISTAVWLAPENFLSVYAQDTSPTDIFFKPDGLRLYVVGSSSDAVHEYSLSSAWSISTASFVGSFSVTAQSTSPTGVFFRDDGLRMYIGDSSNIYEYNLSTAWDINTATYQRQVANPSGVSARSMRFKSDGLIMFSRDNTLRAILKYNLSSAWDITTAQWEGDGSSGRYSIAAQDSGMTGVFFKPDGLNMFAIATTGDSVHQYSLSTAWDISTASFVRSFSVAAKETIPQGVFFKTDGLKMYIIGWQADSIHEYNLSTAWNISTATFVQTLSVTAQEANPTGIFFRPDTGGNMYVVGEAGDEVNQYSTSSWNISTASLQNVFSVSAQMTNPKGIFFKSDGLRMYIVGQNLVGVTNGVHEYSLSSGWNITTASFVRSFSTTEAAGASDIFFKSDGLSMFVTNSQTVHEYTLSTAWDISTAVYAYDPPGTLKTGSTDAAMQGFYVSPSGFYLYSVGTVADLAYEYALSSPWNLSGASLSESVSVAAQSTSPQSISFKPDGTKMYVVGQLPLDGVHEYDLS